MKRGTIHKAEFNQWVVVEFPYGETFSVCPKDIYTLNNTEKYTEGDTVAFTLDTINVAKIEENVSEN